MDTIVLDGDMVNFDTSFAPAIVMVRPGRMTGSGERVQNRRMCVETDISNLVVPGVPYTSGAYMVPGMGMLRIEQLHPTSLSRKTKSLGQSVILKGMPQIAVVARFQVTQPAMMLGPNGLPIPDPMMVYTGRGWFSCMPPFVQGE